MTRGLALLFASIGVLLLLSISFFLATNQPWWALAAAFVSLFFIGFGFIVKARLRRKNSQA